MLGVDDDRIATYVPEKFNQTWMNEVKHYGDHDFVRFELGLYFV